MSSELLKKRDHASASGEKRAKRKPKRKEAFSVYIYKILKQVHPDLTISSKAVSIMNSFVSEVFEFLASKEWRRAALSSREVQVAAGLLLPGELLKHTDPEGTEAVPKHTPARDHPKPAWPTGFSWRSRCLVFLD